MIRLVGKRALHGFQTGFPLNGGGGVVNGGDWGG